MKTLHIIIIFQNFLDQICPHQLLRSIYAHIMKEKKNTRFITNSKTRDELYFVFIIHFKWNIINHYHFLKYYYLFFKTQFIALVKTMFYNLFIKILLLTIELFIQKLLFIHFVYILYNWISNFKELKFAWIFQSWSSN